MKNNKDPREVPEVADLIGAQERYETFKKRHSKIFEELESICADYNQKLEAADKVVRQQQISCGPFDLYQTSTTYDAKALYDALGRDKFIQVGGTLSVQTIYDVDKVRVRASIDTGAVPEDVAEVVQKVSPRYHKPAKIELP